MKTTRIKNLLIWIFLITDLALGIILYTDHISATQPSAEEIDAVVSLLSSNGITLNPAILTAGQTLSTLTLTGTPHSDNLGKKR